MDQLKDWYTHVTQKNKARRGGERNTEWEGGLLPQVMWKKCRKGREKKHGIISQT